MISKQIFYNILANNNGTETPNGEHTKKMDAIAPVVSSFARLRLFLEEVAS